MDCRGLLLGQLEFYWDAHLWPRLDGLTDEEYLWEPTPGCWSVRPDGTGRFRLDTADPVPDPPPLTTLAWRIVHVSTALSIRTSTFFRSDVPDEADMFDPRHMPIHFPGTAADALTMLADSYREWHDNLVALDEAGFAAPLGPRGGWFAKDSMAALVVHLNREVMHHGGEICLMRDLYRARV